MPFATIRTRCRDCAGGARLRQGRLHTDGALPDRHSLVLRAQPESYKAAFGLSAPRLDALADELRVEDLNKARRVMTALRLRYEALEEEAGQG
jgi:hypothetical protein